jgi:uncharacterized sporulation protein YeaH/YhbH (DUF444 family)
MSSSIIDRRKNASGKSGPNRQRFLKRVEGQIKKAIPNIVDGNTIKDMVGGKGRVKIPIKGIDEPGFDYDNETGDKKYVHPGNKEYDTGDKIRKPQGGQGKGGRKGSKDGDPTEDEFTISISRDEFFDYFFNDLELPELVKRELSSNVDYKMKRAGYTNAGIPSRLNIVNSYKQSLGRRLAMKAAYEKQIEKLKEELNKEKDEEKRKVLIDKIEKTEALAKVIPYMDDTDLIYNNFEPKPIPSFNAAMFCIMDVSGSMGEKEKDIGKRFFMLLYMFLVKQYDNVDIVFIRHHTQASEVDEETFFNSRESGGTVVAPSLILMDDIINERYGQGWNLYCSQVSDGDVWGKEDADECYSLLKNKILKKLQYMIYVEVCRDDSGDLWNNYNVLSSMVDNFAVGQISEVNEIWSVFKEFFKKKVS